MKVDRRSKGGKLTKLDYAVMIGGPILFFVIFWVGVRLIIGPIPEPSPVQKLRDGKIAIGASMTEVRNELGRPSRVQQLPDGGSLFVYTRTVYEEATRSDSLDEATVEFTPGGRVQAIRFDRSAPPSPSANP
jgi:hypothetical protein